MLLSEGQCRTVLASWLQLKGTDKTLHNDVNDIVKEIFKIYPDLKNEYASLIQDN